MKKLKFDICPIAVQDKDAWRKLFDGYAEFYKVELTNEVADRTFDWLLDPNHVLEGLIAHDQDGAAAAIAHYRACPRPLGGCEIGFLDDMFVAPSARGTGVADEIFACLSSIAHVRGWASLRWITQHFNERGRAFYDRHTEGPSDFIMYQWNVK